MAVGSAAGSPVEVGWAVSTTVRAKVVETLGSAVAPRGRTTGLLSERCSVGLKSFMNSEGLCIGNSTI